MRVNIYETVEVSDEQRAAIAEKIGRPATRDELKSYIWDRGRNWFDGLFADPAVEVESHSGGLSINGGGSLGGPVEDEELDGESLL